MIDAHLDAARAASLQGQHQHAVDLCVAVLQHSPGHPRALAFLALSLWRARAFAHAVGALQEALVHFPAQEELSLALLDSMLVLGDGERALQFAATLPEELLAQQPLRSRIEDHLIHLLTTGDLVQLEAMLSPLMQAQPGWHFAQTLLASVMFNSGGRGAAVDTLHSFDAGADATQVAQRWKQDLASAMSAYRDGVMEQIRTALRLQPADAHALELQARTRFEQGEVLEADERLLLERQLGVSLVGPFALRHALVPGAQVEQVQVLEPIGVLDIARPRSIGQALRLDESIGLALTSTRYVAQAAGARVAAGSDVVLLAGDDAWCDLLTHPLGELTSCRSDSWIALASTRKVVLRALPTSRVRGSAVSLLGSGARFYGHWLLDFLIRLRTVGIDRVQACGCVLVEDGMPASHYDALRLLVGVNVRLQRVAAGCAVQVDRLFFCGAEVFFPHGTRIGAPAWGSVAPSRADGMAWLRQRMLAALPGIGKAKGRRLFVARTSAARRVLNEDAVRDKLVQHWGFEVVHPETLSFADQMRCFNAAEVVVGSQGSAMSNCVFCAPGAAVVSLCSSFAANFPSWAHALEQLGIRHCFVVGEAQQGSNPMPVLRDLRVELEDVCTALEELGVAPGCPR